MFSIAIWILAQGLTPGRPAGGWSEWRFAAGGGTPFVAYLGSCTDRQLATSENIPGNVGWTMDRCVAMTFNEMTTTHSHGMRIRALKPNGAQVCEVATTIQPNMPPRVVAAVEAVYPSQPSSKVPPGKYKVQVCRKEVVPPGGKAEDKQPEYCSAFGTLQVRPGADSVRCALTSH